MIIWVGLNCGGIVVECFGKVVFFNYGVVYDMVGNVGWIVYIVFLDDGFFVIGCD